MPPRRSARVASRASSVAADENNSNNGSPNVLRPAKSSGVRKTSSSTKGRASKPKSSQTLDEAKIEYILDRLFHHDDYYLVDELTEQQQVVLLEASNKRQQKYHARTLEVEAERQELQAEVTELSNINENLMKERDAAKEEARKRHMRDIFYRDEVQKAEIQRKAEALAKELVAAELLRATSQRMHIDATASTTQTSSDTTTPIKIYQAPAVPATAPARSNSLLRRVLTGFASPFVSRSSSLATVPEATVAPETAADSERPSRPESPLGHLPSSRKRSAPASDEPRADAERVPSTPTPAPRTAPRSQKVPATMPIALSTISERSEPLQSTPAVADPTPCRPRPINKVRAARLGLAKTPSRAWGTKSVTREPNADLRQERLMQKKAAEESPAEQVERQAHESRVAEIKEVAPRPTKRVKLDQLVAIPHNRPGDAEGTYRFPDLDSDDEMEVDIDAPVRANMFDELEAQAASERVKQQKTEPKQAVPTPAPEHTSAARPTFSAMPAIPATLPAAEKEETSKPDPWADEIEAARLRQETHQIRQWLQECQPEHAQQLHTELAQAEQAEKLFVSNHPASATTPQAASVDPETEPYLPLYEFPSGGSYQEQEPMDPEEEEFLALEFEYGFRHWQRTGVCLPIY